MVVVGGIAMNIANYSKSKKPVFQDYFSSALKRLNVTQIHGEYIQGLDLWIYKSNLVPSRSKTKLFP